MSEERCRMLQLVIPSYKKFLPLLGSFVNVSAEVFGVEEIREKIELCAEEAFVHLLERSYREERGDIVIGIEVDERYFLLSFLDRGLPIDITFPQSAAQDMDSVDAEGLQLLLIQQFTFKAEWINRGKEGREFRLCFELPQRAIYTLPQPEEDEHFDVSPEEIEIRRFDKRWANEISQIIYQAYGYSYPNEDLYYPERIVALNESGRLVSVVAYDTRRNRIAGHYALEREDLGSVAEIGQAVVAPAYRGLGLMKKIRLETQEAGRELGLEGIMSKPVTVHLFSQKTNEALGAVPVGMGFGVSPEKKFKKIEGAGSSQRGSCMYYYLPLKNRHRTLHLPRRHRKIVESIYRDLGLDYTVAEASAVPDTEGRVRSSYAKNFETGSIYVTQIGRGSPARVREAFFDLVFRMGAKAVVLYIVTEDADVEELTAAAEEDRFFFSGVLPSFAGGRDVLVYGFLPEDVDESQIRIFSDRAKEIVRYVSEEKRRVF